jgi:hypothetical protein
LSRLPKPIRSATAGISFTRQSAQRDGGLSHSPKPIRSATAGISFTRQSAQRDGGYLIHPNQFAARRRVVAFFRPHNARQELSLLLTTTVSLQTPFPIPFSNIVQKQMPSFGPEKRNTKVT